VIEGYAQKLLMLKLASLWEHDGQRKATIVIATMVVGEYYILKTNQHVFNKHLHVVKGEIVCCTIGSCKCYGKKKKKTHSIFINFSLAFSK
jgi:hypothetical protein